MEVFYNRRRRHSTLGYRTPSQTWTDHHTVTGETLAAAA
ncbi:hypothetical protein [Corynebacterium striatum]